MRRIILVIGLVALLAATITVPATAHTSPSVLSKLAQAAIPFGGPAWNDTPLGLLFGPPNNNDETIEPFVNTSDPSNVSSSNSLDPSGVSSSSDLAVDPPGVSQQFSERRITSGSASPSSSFSNSGNNVNACPTTQQVVNTGNVTNQQGVSQYDTNTGDIDASGSSITITPDVTATCDQTLNQAAGG